jgi:hypothetical protein
VSDRPVRPVVLNVTGRPLARTNSRAVYKYIHLTRFGRDGAVAADEIQRDQLRRDSVGMAPLLRLPNRTARHTRPETKRWRWTFQSGRTRGQSRTNLAPEEWTKEEEEEWRTDHHSRCSVEVGTQESPSRWGKMAAPPPETEARREG